MRMFFYKLEHKNEYIVSLTSESGSEIIIPETYEGLPVTEAVMRLTDTEVIKIPRYLKSLRFDNIRTDSSMIAEISPDNPYLVTDGNAVYSKNMSVLFVVLARDKESFEVPDGVRRIEDEAFFHLKNLREVILPESLAEIGSGAFEFCESLEKINLENVRVIDEYAFCHCERLDNIKLKCKNIPYSAFSYCESLSLLVLEKTKTIGEKAFYNTAIIDPVLPKGLRVISGSAFDRTAWTLSLPESIERIEGKIEAGVIEIIKPKKPGPLFCSGEGIKTQKSTRLVIRSAKGETLCEVKCCASIQCCLHKDKPLGFDFEKYDRSFPFGIYDPIIYDAAFFRVEFPYELSEETRAGYEEYLNKFVVSFVSEFIDSNNAAKMFSGFPYWGGVSDEDFMRLIELSTKQGNIEFTAFLLQKKNELGRKDDDDGL